MDVRLSLLSLVLERYPQIARWQNYQTPLSPISSSSNADWLSVSNAPLQWNLGYSIDDWQQLEVDIRRFHLTQDVNLVTETAYGTKYQISSNLLTPVNRPLMVKTVWQIDINTDFPRLITLVPD
jgi:hypothetical protein